MTLKTRPKCIPCFLGITVYIILAQTAHAGKHWTTMTPEERFERVLWLRHGAIDPRGVFKGPYDDETQQLIVSVLDDPETYCPMIDEMLSVPDDPMDLTEWKTRSRLSRAIGLAGHLGPEYCRGSVKRFFDNILELYTSIRCNPSNNDPDKENNDVTARQCHAKHECNSLLTSALRVLGEFEDAHGLDYCMAMIELYPTATGDVGPQWNMLLYMAKVAPQRPECRAELERMYNDRESRLYHQPRLKKVIDVIDAKAASEEPTQHQP